MASTKDAAKKYSFAVAKVVLTDTEKDRFLACYLNLIDPNAAIDWEKAAADFGSASVASFKKMVQTACKKVTDAEKNGGTSPMPSKAKAGAARGKKRKAATLAEGDDEEAEAEASKVKKGKGGGRKKKKADMPVEDEDAVKDEVGDEDEELF